MSFLSVLKDIGTSTVRIVTDTAIDVGNVATGFQFNGSMESAKKSMDDVGLKSAATAIRDNHFPEIDALTAELKQRGERMKQKIDEHTARSEALNERLTIYHRFSDQAHELSLLQHEVHRLIRVTHGQVPELTEFQTHLDDALHHNPPTGSPLDSTQRALIYSQLGAGIGATVGVATAVMSSSATVAKVAGRATAVLAVVSVGLDVGLAFKTYDKQLGQLREMQSRAIADEKAVDEELVELGKRTDQVTAALESLLHSCVPPQSEAGFPAWVEARRKELLDVKGDLEAQARRQMEDVLASLIAQGQTDESLLVKVARSFFPDITEQSVRDIIHSKTERT